MVHIEEQLKKAGKLKGPADSKQFWDSMLSLSPPPPPPPSPPLEAASNTHRASNKEEEKEKEEYENSWALTALPADCYKKVWILYMMFYIIKIRSSLETHT